MVLLYFIKVLMVVKFRSLLVLGFRFVVIEVFYVG